MTRETLLKSAIKDYKDFKNQVKAIPYKRFVDKGGYCFIIKQNHNAFNLNCAIHISTEWAQNEYLGNIRSVDISLISRQRLTTDLLIEYEDLIIFVKSYDAYNETMGQFEYKGSAIKANDFILLKEPNTLYGSSVYEKLLSFDKYKIVPKYLSLNEWDKDYILVDIESLNTFTLTTPHFVNNTLSQMKSDKVIFYLANVSREKLLNFQNDLIEYSLNFGEFGFLSNPILRDEKNLDSNAVTQSIISSVECELSYNLEVSLNNDENKLINDICYQVKNYEIENDKDYPNKDEFLMDKNINDAPLDVEIK